MAFSQGAFGCSKIAAEQEKNRAFFFDRIFCRPMKRTAGASGERVKVDRRMAVRTGTDRFVKMLLEIPSARIENAELKISCVG